MRRKAEERERASESNEHIDLMRLIVMQLISCAGASHRNERLAAERNKLGLAAAAPSSFSFFFLLFFFFSSPSLSRQSLDTYQRRFGRRGVSKVFLLVSLHLSAFIPSPTATSLSALFRSGHVWSCLGKSDCEEEGKQDREASFELRVDTGRNSS